MPAVATFGSASARSFGRGSNRILVAIQQTFTSNATWIAPPGVTNLASVVGNGAAGTAAYTTGGVTTPGEKLVHYETIYTKKDGTQEYVDSGWATWSGPTQPANTHTTTYIGDTSTVYNYRDSYVTYSQTPDTTTPVVEHAATTGASATAFGFTFAGGVGGSATPATQTNVAVTPSGSYDIVVPSGASVTLNFFQ